MKKLIIMRHAKSDWSNSSLRDFDRPLNKRGRGAAPYMGKEIKKRGLTPDLIISSPALRAKMTAEAVAKNCAYRNEIVWNDNFYFGHTHEIIDTIKNVDESTSNVMVFGHNPTWTTLAEYLSGDVLTMKTADMVVLQFSGEWRLLSENSCNQILHLSPKEIM